MDAMLAMFPRGLARRPLSKVVEEPRRHCSIVARADLAVSVLHDTG